MPRCVVIVNPGRSWASTTHAALIVAAVFLAIYLPDAGHGFISDDFRWIVESRAASAADLVGLLTKNIGFHRPLVSVSFAADYGVWGTNAFGYALTNLALCLACAVLLFLLARRLGLPSPAALLAASVWLFNFHAVNMAVLWLSGRTALLASVFCLSAVHVAFGRRAILAGVFALLAMLAKEEAVVLPVLLVAIGFRGAWPAAGTPDRGTPARTMSSAAAALRASAIQASPAWVALAIYLGLRAQSGAFWPGNAPSYYQFSFAPGVVARNVLEYADRAGTVFIAVAILLAVLARVRRTDISPAERGALMLAALWTPAMFALTLFLPVRSSLYALLPSIGSAVALGAVAAAARRRAPKVFSRATLGLIVLAVLLVPIYRSRNVRWVRLAELSEASVRTIRQDAGNRASGHVVLIDAPAERFNLASAFGNLLPEALRLRVGDGWTGEVVGAAADATRPADLAYRLSEGALVPIPAAR